MSYDPVRHGANCKNCPRRGQTPVGPSGPTGARICWLGQDPGVTEVQMGQPFVGATGKRLANIWAQAEKSIGKEIPRREIFVTNTCCCLPVTKSPKEAKLAADCCRPRLLAELSQLHPDAWILAMGKWAYYALSGKLKGQGKFQGFHLPWRPDEAGESSPADMGSGGGDGEEDPDVVQDDDPA